MKKILLFTILFSLLFISKFIFAQDSGDTKLKNFRFGLFGQASLCWYNPGSSSIISSKGSTFDFGYGLNMEFRITKVASFVTGIGGHYSGGKLGFTKDTVIYSYNSNKDTFMLSSRKYKVSYITIPLVLKLKSAAIGAFTYYGEFGVDLSIKTKATSITDGGYVFTPPYNSLALSSQPKVDISKDMAFAEVGLNIGAGFEYNLAGTTSLEVGINYHNGFTNVLRSKSKQLYQYQKKDVTPLTSFSQKTKSDYISLMIGILF